MSALLYAAAYGHQDVVALLRSAPRIDDDCKLPVSKQRDANSSHFALDAASSLSAECMDKDYLENRAIYIFDSLVEEIKIDSTNNIKTINLKILNWLKGDENTDAFQIITGVAEHGESAKIEEDKYYRIYLQKVPNSDELIFVCAFKGVKELGLI